jgi:hypothetical protein
MAYINGTYGEHYCGLECGYYGCPKSRQTQLDKEKKMSVVSKIKQLTLSKEDRLLRKYELVSDCGDVTDEGQEVLWSIILETHKAELVKRVKELDEEEKSKKKK